MSSNTYTGSASAVENHFSTIIDPGVLANILSGIPLGPDGTYTVGATDGSLNFKANSSQFDVAIVNDDLPTIEQLIGAAPNASGGYDDIGPLATYMTNADAAPVTIVAAGPAFVELQGSATVAGAAASPFVVDASHDVSDVKLEAGSGNSFLLGGSGNDTLTGSTSDRGHAILVAGSGNTTMTGGLGTDSLYGGGHTTMTGGSGAYQLLADYTPNAQDSIYAGTGGHQTLSVSSGASKLFDTGGSNDSLYAGSGSDTLYGSANGSSEFLYQGNSTVVSTGSDSIAVASASASHTDTITASTVSGALDTVTFSGYDASTVAGLVLDAQKAINSSDPSSVQSVTITFPSSTPGVTQTATLNNVSHITFK